MVLNCTDLKRKKKPSTDSLSENAVIPVIKKQLNSALIIQRNRSASFSIYWIKENPFPH